MSQILAAIAAAVSSPPDACNYTWIGSAPLCDAVPTDCVSANQQFVRYDKSGDGHKCFSGEKVLCKSCPPSQDFLANWMGKLMPVLGNSSILDLSLPGTHDAMTFDLSSIISDNANDLDPKFAWILHEIGPVVKEVGVGAFIKQLAQTQGLSMRGQLEAGVRFVDFRVTHTAAPHKASTSKKDWYSLHMVQSNNKALTYLQQAKDFLDDHPSEVIVIWISRHGSECAMGEDQYPNTTPEERQAFWQQIKDMFGDLIFDRGSISSGSGSSSSSSSSSNSSSNSDSNTKSNSNSNSSRSAGVNANSKFQRLNETTLSEMVSRGQRVVVYASDFADFTANDTKAYDACDSLSNNMIDASIDDIEGSVQAWEDTFSASPEMQREALANDQMFLVSLAGGPPVEAAKDAFYLDYDMGIEKKKTTANCANAFNVPNMTFCPKTLLDVEQLRAYYVQSVMELIVMNQSDDIGFPGAIYMDALDQNGLIRTGTTLLSQEVGSGGNSNSNSTTVVSGTTGYAYVDTMILYNVQKACKNANAQHPHLPNTALCTAHIDMIQQRRQSNGPYKRWDDFEHGRIAAWPNNSLPTLHNSGR